MSSKAAARPSARPTASRIAVATVMARPIARLARTICQIARPNPTMPTSTPASPSTSPNDMLTLETIRSDALTEECLRHRRAPLVQLCAVRRSAAEPSGGVAFCRGGAEGGRGDAVVGGAGGSLEESRAGRKWSAGDGGARGIYSGVRLRSCSWVRLDRCSQSCSGLQPSSTSSICCRGTRSRSARSLRTRLLGTLRWVSTWTVTA
jgi:hypothetical protein